MMHKSLFGAILVGLSGAVQAHEVWIERDGTGPARIYLGEPADILPEGGDPEFGKLKTPKLIPASTAPQTRKAGYIEVAAPAGDVRAWDDNVFAPWDAGGKKQGVVYYARAGRSDPRAAMALEIVPVAANGNRFALMRDGKVVPGANVTVITPDKWSKTVRADDKGAIDVPLRESGRYLLSASMNDELGATLPSGPVATLHRNTTTTFVVP